MRVQEISSEQERDMLHYDAICDMLHYDRARACGTKGSTMYEMDDEKRGLLRTSKSGLSELASAASGMWSK